MSSLLTDLRNLPTLVEDSIAQRIKNYSSALIVGVCIGAAISTGVVLGVGSFFALERGIVEQLVAPVRDVLDVTSSVSQSSSSSSSEGEEQKDDGTPSRPRQRVQIVARPPSSSWAASLERRLEALDAKQRAAEKRMDSLHTKWSAYKMIVLQEVGRQLTEMEDQIRLQNTVVKQEAHKMNACQNQVKQTVARAIMNGHMTFLGDREAAPPRLTDQPANDAANDDEPEPVVGDFLGRLEKGWAGKGNKLEDAVARGIRQGQIEEEEEGGDEDLLQVAAGGLPMDLATMQKMLGGMQQLLGSLDSSSEGVDEDLLSPPPAGKKTKMNKEDEARKEEAEEKREDEDEVHVTS